jgi:hypothetical protein
MRSGLDRYEAAREIAAEFGVDRAITYLVGEKFINFVSAAETEKEFREELPVFAAEIRDIFERWQSKFIAPPPPAEGASPGPSRRPARVLLRLRFPSRPAPILRTIFAQADRH